jgi:hypothetical protein
LPVCGLTVLAITATMLTGKIPRWVGAILVLLYLGFVIGGYVGGELSGLRESTLDEGMGTQQEGRYGYVKN